jgi:hypothetical protein
MDGKRGDFNFILMLWFNIIYIAIFFIYSFYMKNYEFFYYLVVMSVIILFIFFNHKKMHLQDKVMLGLTILGVMHIAGGNFYLGSVRLYDWWIIPNVFRYDQFVHLFGAIVITFVIYDLLKPYLKKSRMQSKVLLSLVFVLMALGAGALNEIVELGAVVFLNTSAGVGDYMNNALDLLYDFIGAIIGCFLILKYYKIK